MYTYINIYIYIYTAAFRHEGVFRHKGVLPRAICIQLALAPTQFTQPGPGRQHPQDMLGRLACDCQVDQAPTLCFAAVCTSRAKSGQLVKTSVTSSKTNARGIPKCIGSTHVGPALFSMRAHKRVHSVCMGGGTHRKTCSARAGLSRGSMMCTIAKMTKLHT